MTQAVPRALAPTAKSGRPLAVGVLGKGAIGGPVITALDSGSVPGAALVAVVDSDGARDGAGHSFPRGELTERTDIVVEAAGQRVLTETGPELVAAGVHLLVLSVGALADRDLHAALSRGPGRLLVSTGAIGGVDLIRALSDAGALEGVTIETTKRPRTVVQDWMDEEERATVLEAPARTEVLRGSPQQIGTAFPRSANVAMATAIAAGDPALVEAAVFADPECSAPTHEIGVRSSAGSYLFHICNQPSRRNPATSELAPFAVVRALHDLAGRRETLI